MLRICGFWIQATAVNFWIDFVVMPNGLTMR